VKAQVQDNIRLAGEALPGAVPLDAGLAAARAMAPAAVIDAAEASGLRDAARPASPRAANGASPPPRPSA
jgi:hypothetical protein